jgi:polysaccharide export outer membrane protein
MRFLLATGLLALSACAGKPRPLGGSPDIAVVAGDAMPPPTRTDIVADNRPYLIGPFDKLTIDVFGIEEMKLLKVQTDASGRISFPLIGSIQAAGQTPAEVGTMIADRLRGRYIRNPQVTVNLDETVSQVVSVGGEVREPGLYPVIGRMTLMRAVSTAKGTAEFAKLSDVVVFRTVDGRKMAALYDLKAIQRGAYSDPEIFANDVIVVGDSPGRRLFRDILQATPLLTAPIIAYLNN